MKKVLIVLLAMGSLTAFAQERKMKREEFTPEQKVELQVKKMTLELDLNEKQQKDLKGVLTQQSKKREEAKAKHKAAKDTDVKPTSDERFAMRSKMMDEKIAFKGEMKKILTADQMAKWEEHKEEHRESRMERREGQQRMMRHKSRK